LQINSQSRHINNSNSLGETIMSRAILSHVLAACVLSATAWSTSAAPGPTAAPAPSPAPAPTKAATAAKPPTSKPAATADAINTVNDLIRHKSGQELLEAVKAAEDAIAKTRRPDTWTIKTVGAWFDLLEDKQRYDAIEVLGVSTISARPDLLELLEKAQAARVRAKLATGKSAEALVMAKSLYNVCSMPYTSQAIDLVCQALYEVNVQRDPAAMVKKFKVEQINGAQPPAAGTAAPSSQPSLAAASENRSVMLAGIKIGTFEFQTVLDHPKASTHVHEFEKQMARGNLLLMGDHVDEAEKIFQKAYALAAEKNMATATEAVARAMRARDGTVGRANAWILSLRAPEQTAQATEN
jgi:hypothetical protein